MDIQAYIQSGIIESYVLGLAGTEEAAELESLQLQFPEVRQAVLDFSLLLESQVMENAIMPPAAVKDRVMAAIREEKAKAPVVALPAADRTNNDVSAKTFYLSKMLAAASVILLVISAALNVYLYSRYNAKDEAYRDLVAQRNTLQANNQIFQTRLQQWQKAAEVLKDPAMDVIKMPGVAGKEQHLATVYWSTKNREVYLSQDRLPQPGEGKQFQLWAIVDGKPVDAGVIDPTCEGVCKMKSIPKAQAFAITLENKGGSPTPTMQQMYVLGKV